MSSSTISRDGRLILTSKAIRSFGYGLLSVLLGLYLEQAGYSPSVAGSVLTAALVGSAGLTIVMAACADRIGRRRTLLLTSFLMLISGLILALSDSVWFLLLAALTGTLSATSGEVGPFETVEQASLPQTTSDEGRNRIFGWYYTLSAITVALGSLAVGLPPWIENSFGVERLISFRLMFGIYSAVALLSLLCVSFLSPAIEVQGGLSERKQKRLLALSRSRKTVAGLAGLFALDAFAGGFVVQSMLAYWFALRFGTGGEVLGPVFLGVNFMKAVSYPLAVKLSDRFGLVNTMVFTHIPSNVLLILIPLMPDLKWAVIFLLLRHLLAQMDVPVRSSYVVAIVDPEERTAATGITTLVRNLAQSAGPVLAGMMLSAVSFAGPFVVAGALKIVYDLGIYAGFRSIHPPDELARLGRGSEDIKMKGSEQTTPGGGKA